MPYRPCEHKNTATDRNPLSREVHIGGKTCTETGTLVVKFCQDCPYVIESREEWHGNAKDCH